MTIASPIPQGYAVNVQALDLADGSLATKTENVGCTLVTGHSYAFPLGGPNSQLVSATPLASAQLIWDASFVGTITIEETNLPRFAGGEVAGGIIEALDWDTTKGHWIADNPSTAYISVTSTDGTTGGATVTNATIVVAGGTAGGAMIQLGNLGSRRCRIKAVATTGGVVRCAVNGKLAA